MKINKKDMVLVGVVLLLAVVSFLFVQMKGNENAGSVRVTVDGVEAGIFPLDQDDEISINNGTNKIKIMDGTVNMIEADCPDHICVDHKPISKNGESIICLPNKVVVEIQSSEDLEFDVMTE